MIICQVCGTENMDSAKYCEGCGVELNQTAGQNVPSIPPSTPETQGDQTSGDQTLKDANQSSEMPQQAAEPDAVAFARMESESPTVAAVSPDGVQPTIAPPVPTPPPVVPMNPTSMSGDASGVLAESSGMPTTTPPVSTPLEVASTDAPAPVQDSAMGGVSIPEGSSGSAGMTSPEAPTSLMAPQEMPPVTPSVMPSSATASTSMTTPAVMSARLVLKRLGTLSDKTIPLSGDRMSVGRFDPSTGPVDLDLSGFDGAEHVSRRHAELYLEMGRWMVRDLGSTNGVYVKGQNESGFGPRLTAPCMLESGDEIAFGNVTFVYLEGSATA